MGYIIIMENSVGNIIRALRKSKNLSQKEFGEKLGFSPRTVSDWEAGNTEPDINTIRALVKFFDITYDEFFDEN